MTTSSSRPSRRTTLRALVVAAAVVGSTLPAWHAAASGPQPTGAPATDRASATAAQPTYALTIHHLGRDGHDAARFKTDVTEFAGAGTTKVIRSDDGDAATTTVRLPKGRYLLSSMLNSKDLTEGTDWVVQPRLDLDRDMSVTIDSRTTAPVDVRPPERSAAFENGTMFVAAQYGGATRYANVIVATPTLRVGHRGPAAEAGSVKQWYDAYWTGKQHRYALGDAVTGNRALTGFTRHPAAKDLAELRIRGATRPGTGSTAILDIAPSGETAGALVTPMPAPGTTSLLVTPGRGPYNIGYSAPLVGDEGETYWYTVKNVAPRLGRTVTHTFDNAVFGPTLAGQPGVVRTGNRLAVDVPLLADGEGHVPMGPQDVTASTTLYRNGKRVKTVQGEPGKATFDVPAGRATYRVTSTVRRPGAPGAATTVTAAWTFTSQHTGGRTAVPVSVVRFTPTLSLTGTAPAGKALRLPVAVQGAASKHTRSLDVAYSVNGGTSWQRTAVVRGVATIPAHKPGTSVSLRAKLTDTAGNTLTQTTLGAYRTR